MVYKVETAPQHATFDLRALYAAAFPKEDLLPLVTALQADLRVVSVVALDGAHLIGHGLFSRCGTDGSDDAGALIGPLAVGPQAQRQGVGTVLLSAMLVEMRDLGIRQAFVLGDPAYYSRVGFSPETSALPPYPLPAEWQSAWQSLCLAAPALQPGKLRLPGPWHDPALWSG